MNIRVLGGAFIACFLFVQPAFAGFIYQNFEPENGGFVTQTVGNAIVSTATRTETVHLGRQALKVLSDWWSGFTIISQISSPIDIKETNNDRLTFWIYAMPHRTCYVYGCEAGEENTVGVIFYDTGAYQGGYEVWTTKTAHYEQWTKLNILFSQLPSDFDLRHVTKVAFKNFKPGKYFFDDIHAVREDRVYQTFEIEDRHGSAEFEYGWKWNDADTAGLSAGGEPVYEGSHSWKLVAAAIWSGTGIQSQEQKYVSPGNQTFWSVDLAPANNDRLTFWVYGLPTNAMDNNVSMQIYDNGAHATDETKVAIWPKTAVKAGQWSRVTVLFSDLKKIAPDLNLSDINKVQFQNYWPGTFYIDDIRAAGPQPVLKQFSYNKTVQWDPITGAANYRLQESTESAAGPWKTIYSGPKTSFTINRISPHWLRVRWEENFATINSLPYASGWSDVIEYLPPAVAFKYANLQTGALKWTALPQSAGYEIQSAFSKKGPWSAFYKGAYPPNGLSAAKGKWYRIRSIQENSGVLTDATPWSRPQSYDPGRNYVKASNTVIRDGDGSGDELVLNGTNLGGALLIEPWMTGLGMGDNPPIPDDWNIRAVLIQRFGQAKANTLLQTYEEAYLSNFDFDSLLKQDHTVVRLPFFYRNLQDDNGNWIRTPNGAIDFSPIDRIVNAFADRGIYVILDLHGAPGLQNSDANSGRANFNKLFAPDGEIYRSRTVALWNAVAVHYKDNRWVLGYDLLNEPVGAGSNTLSLWDLYDRIYKSIRAVDANHLVIMEGIWYPDPADPETDPNKKRQIVDWATLPYPQTRNWTNIMYQFHFYHWNYIDANGNLVNADENYESHKAFIDQKVADAALAQPQYNVPVLIGEFYGFGLKPVWDYYIQNFNASKWSWTSWTYKYHDSPANWGLVYHSKYDEDLPKIQTDLYNTLARKFGKYTTPDYHLANSTLQEMFTLSSRSFGLYPPQQINSGEISPPPVPPGTGLSTFSDGTFSFSGNGLGDTPGTIQFYPAPCTDIPPGTIACNNGDAGISYWSETLVKGYLPPDGDASRYTMHSQYGGDLYPTMLKKK